MIEEQPLNENSKMRENLSGLSFVEKFDKVGVIGASTIPIIKVLDIYTSGLFIEDGHLVHVPHDLKGFYTFYARCKYGNKWQSIPTIISVSDQGFIDYQYIYVHEITDTEIVFDFWNMAIPENIQIYFTEIRL